MTLRLSWEHLEAYSIAAATMSFFVILQPLE